MVSSVKPLVFFAWVKMSSMLMFFLSPVRSVSSWVEVARTQCCPYPRTYRDPSPCIEGVILASKGRCVDGFALFEDLVQDDDVIRAHDWCAFGRKCGACDLHYPIAGGSVW